MSKKTINHYFSIVIPLYNKAEYIKRAIESITNQTYQNFEIIVVNDGSNDNSEKIVESICDNRIILVNQQNQGVSAARNNGANKSKYGLLTFLDADDIWLDTFLEEANKLVNKYPDAGIYGLNNYFEYPNGKVIFEKYEWLFNGEKSGFIENYFALFVKIGKSPFSNSNYCIPKKIFQNEGGYKLGVRLTEDSDLWCRIALKYKIAYLTTPLATYYLETSGSTHYLFEPNEFQVTITLRNAIKSNQVRQEFKKSVNKLIAFQQLSLIKRSILTGNKLFALKKIFNRNLFYNYPMNSCIFFFLSFLPTRLFSILRKDNSSTK